MTWVAQANWQNVDVDADAPEESWPKTTHGMILRITGPDGRLIFQYSGHERPDGSHSGHGDAADLDSAAFQTAVCDALTG